VQDVLSGLEWGYKTIKTGRKAQKIAKATLERVAADKKEWLALSSKKVGLLF
jgi:hypothetical protein